MAWDIFQQCVIGSNCANGVSEVGPKGSGVILEEKKGSSAPVTVERRLCSLDFAAVGSDVYVVDPVSGDLVSSEGYSRHAIVKQKGGYVVGVYCYLEGAALEAFKLRNARLSPAGGERGRDRE